MEQLEGRTAVITGAASGIGRATAAAAAAAGMRVVAADVDPAGLAETASIITAAGGEVTVVPTDVRDPASVDALGRAALDAYGAVHLVHNNAGVLTGGFCWEKTLDDWRWVLDVNLWGVIHGVRTFVPLLLEQGEGHVVNTASVGGLGAGALLAPYTVSKFGVVALSESLFNELQMIGSDVGVTCLCPGQVSTGIFRSERNRPGDYPETSGPKANDPTAGAVHDRVAASVDAGWDPARIADAVLDAVRSNRFWLVTHDDALERVQTRTAGIVNGTNPVWG